MIVFGGEAGIGKSRLVVETKLLAAQQEYVCLQGNCFETDRALPYAPLLDLVRACINSKASSETADRLQPFAPELIKLLPELAASFPDTLPTPPLEAEQEKRRHFQTLANFLIGWTLGIETKPLLIVFEDLHWSDDTSLEFLLFFTRQIVIQPISICLLLTYRADEIHAHPALRHFLAELDRGRLATELTLTRLTRNDVGEMLRVIFPQSETISDEFIDRIYSLTDGTPFFIEEILKSLVAAGEIFSEDWSEKPLDELGIPRTVQDAVQGRVARLSPKAQQVLALAAVAGRRFDFALLRELTQKDERALTQIIKELVKAQLIDEESSEGFTFHHALTRQAVYTMLLKHERRALHRRVGEAIQRLHSDQVERYLEELAYHFYEAQAWEKALHYAQRAGEKAQQLYAPRAAVGHYTRSIESAAQLSLPAPINLFRVRGEMWDMLGEFGAARGDYQMVLNQARTQGDRQTEWQVLIDLGALWTAQDYVIAGEYFKAGLDIARSLNDPMMLATTLNRVGNWHTNIEQPLEGFALHRQALHIFESLNDRAGIAASLHLMGHSSTVASDILHGVVYGEQAIALFRELNDQSNLHYTLGFFATRGVNYGDRTAMPFKTPLAERVRYDEEALQIAHEIGERPGESLGLTWLGLNYASAGEYGKAFKVIRKALIIAQEIEHHHFMAVAHFGLGGVYLDILALPDAQVHFEQALSLARKTNTLIWTRVAASLLISTYILQKQLPVAESLLASLFTPDLPMQSVGQRHLWRARAELDLAQGDAKQALKIVEKLIASAPNLDVQGEETIFTLALLRAEALAALGRSAEAEKILQASQQAARDYEVPPMMWRLYIALGQRYLARGRRDEAAEAFLAARSIVETIAVGLEDVALQNTFRRAALERLSRVKLDSQRRKAKKLVDGLTGREHQVAILIAQGKSNREISEILALSLRTVETHITNIMSKLQVSSRTQIASWVMKKEQG